MAFVKLDCGILNSTLWVDRDAREVFITALLMAEPFQLEQPTAQLNVRNLDEAGWEAPPGWYGMVQAAGIGIIHRSGIEQERGLAALERLGCPEPDSRSREYEGRRLVRVDGGYLVLNFDKYRRKDHSAAERSRRYRERKASRVAPITSRVATRSTTQAEAEVEADAYKDKSTALVTLSRDASHPTSMEKRSNGKALSATAVIDELHAVGQQTAQRQTKEAFRGVMVKILFAYWATRLGHDKALLDSKRRQVLARRLAENGDNLSELLYAVDGALRDEWTMGRANNSQRKYDGVETIFRDREQVERFAGSIPAHKAGTPHPMAIKYGSAHE